jgi:hypothetical protein
VIGVQAAYVPETIDNASPHDRLHAATYYFAADRVERIGAAAR